MDVLLGRCLDRDNEAIFDDGWSLPRRLPPVARQIGRRAGIQFTAPPFSRLALDLGTQVGDVSERPLLIRIALNGTPLEVITVDRPTWRRVDIPIPPQLRAGAASFELTFDVTRAWAEAAPSNTADDHELLIAACNIQLFPKA